MSVTGTITPYLNRLRLELGDQTSPFTVSVNADGTTNQFNLPNAPINATGLTVTLNGTPTSAYTLDSTNGILLLTAVPTSGTVVAASGTYYRYFSDTDLTTFLDTAFVQHTHGRTNVYGQAFDYDSLPGIEQYLVVLLALVEALYVLATNSSYDINIITPEGVSVPRSQRFQQLLTMIQTRDAEYRDICQQLNVGIHRIEMFNLRRVSRTTGKLIPLYIEKELNDNFAWQQVFPGVDHMGMDTTAAFTDGVPVTNITLTQGKHFTYTYTAGSSLAKFSGASPGSPTGINLRAYIRRTEFDMGFLFPLAVTLDGDNVTVHLELHQQQTYLLPPICYWDLRGVDPTDENSITTITRGQVTVIQQVVT